MWKYKCIYDQKESLLLCIFFLLIEWTLTIRCTCAELSFWFMPSKLIFWKGQNPCVCCIQTADNFLMQYAMEFIDKNNLLSSVAFSSGTDQGEMFSVMTKVQKYYSQIKTTSSSNQILLIAQNMDNLVKRSQESDDPTAK